MTRAPFHSGVIEGFYGRPWNEPQRRRMLTDLGDLGLNTYLYAPKDDLEHRALWREPYPPDGLAALGRLVQAAEAAGVRLVYGIAPGLDLRFADEADTAALSAKVAQVLDAGVHGVALLFDDVPRGLRPEDAERFGTLAAAQAGTANRLHARLHAAGKGALLFCPTDYCAAMARPDLTESGYLRELGERLEPAIEVLWTGSEVVSRKIQAADARAAAAVLKRKPLLWDSLHANDYDLRRLHLGPYSGRNAALTDEVSGILLNPNNEPGANAVPLMTFAAYLREEAYEPRTAFLEAVRAWAGRLELAGVPEGAGPHGGTVDPDDLAFLADFLYLPFEHGPAAQAFLEDVAYLLATPAAAWGTTFDRVAGDAGRLARLTRTLGLLRDRELLAALHPYLMEVLTAVGTAARRIAARSPRPPAGASRDGIGNVGRGGFAGALEDLLDACREDRSHEP